MSPAAFSYGSDESGLVWGFLLRAGGQPLPIGAADAVERMRAHTDLRDEFYDVLHQGSRSTRIEIADDALIAVINDVLHNFSFDSAEFSTLWAHVAPHGVISARRKPLESIERLRQAVLQGAAVMDRDGRSPGSAPGDRGVFGGA